MTPTTQNEPGLSRRGFLAAGVAGAVAATAARTGMAAEMAEKRPNIIVLLTDDQRWDSLGCMGNPYVRTPNIDRLGSEGVIFDNNFVTTSICMSSRASIFTGLYVRCHGIDDFSKMLPPQAFAQTYPMLLRAAGYRTGFIGKWGVGNELPAESFDYFKGFPGQGQYFHEIDGEQVHLTRIMGDQSLEFLNGCSAEQPFCLSVSFKAPHVQDQDPRQYLYDPAFESHLADVTMPTPETATEADFMAMPQFIRDSENRTRWERRFATPEMFQNSVKGYYRLIDGVDVTVGRIVEQLEEQGLADNTVILFTGDNGIFNGEHGLAGKWLMHEESIRTPFIVWDGRARTGKRLPQMTLNIDLCPTVLDYAGIEAPEAMQGNSVRPLVEGAGVPWRTEWFYEHEYGHGGRIAVSEGIRTERWKYICYPEHEPVYEELYDLENDPIERHNLVNDDSVRGQLDALRARWTLWREALAAWKPDMEWHDPGDA